MINEVLYKGRYSQQILEVVAEFDFAKVRKLMEVNREIWEVNPDEVGIPSIKEIMIMALTLLAKVEVHPDKNATYSYKGLVALKSPTDIGLMYVPHLVAKGI